MNYQASGNSGRCFINYLTLSMTLIWQTLCIFQLCNSWFIIIKTRGRRHRICTSHDHAYFKSILFYCCSITNMIITSFFQMWNLVTKNVKLSIPMTQMLLRFVKNWKIQAFVLLNQDVVITILEVESSTRFWLVLLSLLSSHSPISLRAWHLIGLLDTANTLEDTQLWLWEW